MHVYIESIKNPGVRFEVMEYNKETKIGKLKGGFGAYITRDISKAELDKRGYKLVKSDTPLSLTPPPAVKAAAPQPEGE